MISDRSTLSYYQPPQGNQMAVLVQFWLDFARPKVTWLAKTPVESNASRQSISVCIKAVTGNPVNSSFIDMAKVRDPPRTMGLCQRHTGHSILRQQRQEEYILPNVRAYTFGLLYVHPLRPRKQDLG
jgi:hypothetical protein